MRRFFSLSAGVVLLSFSLPQPASSQVGGVYIDPKGMLRQTSSLTKDEQLALLRAHAVGQPGRQLAAGSTLRKVSLNRLQAAVVAARKNGTKLPADVRFLAGLTGIQYVFFDPAANDVILAGPAEGWKQLPSGEVVGNATARPVLHLDDLIAALRYTFARQQRSFIGCSIDPTADGVKRYAAYMRRLGRIDRSRVKQIFAGMEQAMGPQSIRLFGVEPSSRFALTLAVADYRLKRIAMAHDPSPVRQVVNYLDLAIRRPLSSRQPQHRWWFLAEYDAIHHTADKLAYQFVGQGVKVATARAFVAEKKGRQPRVAPAAKQFSESFTRHFPALAKKIPVFGELQNLIALSVAAELIAQHHYGEVSTKGDRYKPTHFLNVKSCPVTKYAVPKTVPSLASYRLVRGRQWLISVSGGVEINPATIAKSAKKASPRSELPRMQRSIRPPKDGGAWWWD